MKIEASLRVEAHGARSLSTLSTFSTFHERKECISSKECVMNFITMHTHAHTCTRLNQASVYTHGNLGCFSIITNVFCSHRCRFRITWLIIRIVFSGLVICIVFSGHGGHLGLHPHRVSPRSDSSRPLKSTKQSHI